MLEVSAAKIASGCTIIDLLFSVVRSQFEYLYILGLVLRLAVCVIGLEHLLVGRTLLEAGGMGGHIGKSVQHPRNARKKAGEPAESVHFIGLSST